ncbi:MAG: STAS domain-containing protein [Pseudomonadota bacterium]
MVKSVAKKRHKGSDSRVNKKESTASRVKQTADEKSLKKKSGATVSAPFNPLAWMLDEPGASVESVISAEDNSGIHEDKEPAGFDNAERSDDLVTVKNPGAEGNGVVAEEGTDFGFFSSDSDGNFQSSPHHLVKEENLILDQEQGVTMSDSPPSNEQETVAEDGKDFGLFDTDTKELEASAEQSATEGEDFGLFANELPAESTLIKEGDTLVLKFADSVTITNIADAHKHAKDALEQSSDIALDISALSKIDGCGLQLLYAIELEIQRQQGNVKVVGDTTYVNLTAGYLGLPEIGCVVNNKAA